MTGLGSIYFPTLANLFGLHLNLTLVNYPSSNSSGIKLSTTDIIMIAVIGSAAVIFLLGCCYRFMGGRWRRTSASSIATPSSRNRNDQRTRAGIVNLQAENDNFATPNINNSNYATEEDRIIAQQEMIMQQNRLASPPSAPPSVDYSDPSYISLWDNEFKILADMGFTDKKAILPLLNKYMHVPASQKPNSNGVPNPNRMQRVINELVSQS